MVSQPFRLILGQILLNNSSPRSLWTGANWTEHIAQYLAHDSANLMERRLRHCFPNAGGRDRPPLDRIPAANGRLNMLQDGEREASPPGAHHNPYFLPQQNLGAQQSSNPQQVSIVVTVTPPCCLSAVSKSYVKGYKYQVTKYKAVLYLLCMPPLHITLSWHLYHHLYLHTGTFKAWRSLVVTAHQVFAFLSCISWLSSFPICWLCLGALIKSQPLDAFWNVPNLRQTVSLQWACR